MRTWSLAGLMLLLVAVPAAAQRRGTGLTRGSAAAPPPTQNSGDTAASVSSTGAVHELPILPQHGFFGAPGAAQDALGPSRLGPRAESPVRGSYGEAAPSTGETYSAWKSGDRVRSASSADVRGARQQQAPDLEWASAGAGPPQLEPQTPYGVKAQEQQQRPQHPAPPPIGPSGSGGLGPAKTSP